MPMALLTTAACSLFFGKIFALQMIPTLLHKTNGGMFCYFNIFLIIRSRFGHLEIDHSSVGNDLDWQTWKSMRELSATPQVLSDVNFALSHYIANAATHLQKLRMQWRCCVYFMRPRRSIFRNKLCWFSKDEIGPSAFARGKLTRGWANLKCVKKDGWNAFKIFVYPTNQGGTHIVT